MNTKLVFGILLASLSCVMAITPSANEDISVHYSTIYSPAQLFCDIETTEILNWYRLASDGTVYPAYTITETIQRDDPRYQFEFATATQQYLNIKNLTRSTEGAYVCGYNETELDSTVWVAAIVELPLPDIRYIKEYDIFFCEIHSNLTVFNPIIKVDCVSNVSFTKTEVYTDATNQKRYKTVLTCKLTDPTVKYIQCSSQLMNKKVTKTVKTATNEVEVVYDELDTIQVVKSSDKGALIVLILMVLGLSLGCIGLVVSLFNSKKKNKMLVMSLSKQSNVRNIYKDAKDPKGYEESKDYKDFKDQDAEDPTEVHAR